MNKHNFKIAVTGCVHGDEIIGKLAIKKLSRLKLTNGKVEGIIANPEALKKHKRFIQNDLNRIFPGKKNGKHESRRAFGLASHLKNFDLIIDIHATNSDFDSLIIVTNLNKRTKNILKLLPVQKVALMQAPKFRNGALINSGKVGIALEYGPNKSGKNFRYPVKDIKQLLVNLGLLSGTKNEFSNKRLYKVFSAYKVSERFIPSKTLKDFKLIKKGQLIGTEKNDPVFSKSNFYPIFLGKGRYQKTLALMSKSASLKL